MVDFCRCRFVVRVRLCLKFWSGVGTRRWPFMNTRRRMTRRSMTGPRGPAANPGLRAGIKSLAYMENEARRVAVTRSDEPSFKALDLNQKIDPTKEMIFSVADVSGCHVDELPERAGPVVIGVDVGEATSGTALCAIWPESGRVEMRLAFGDKPSLADRGRADNAPYTVMAKRGELVTYSGRVTPVRAFLADLVKDMAGQHVHALAADSYKDSESLDFFEGAGVRLAGRVSAGGRGQRWRARRAGFATARTHRAGQDDRVAGLRFGGRGGDDSPGSERKSGSV